MKVLNTINKWGKYILEVILTYYNKDHEMFEKKCLYNERDFSSNNNNNNNKHIHKLTFS